MSKKKVGIGIVLIALVGGAVWAFWSGPDPQVEKVKQLQQEAMKAPPEKRQEMFAQVRTQMEQLKPEQREMVFHDMRAQFEQRMQQEIKGYFALPPQQRVAYLDKQIDEMEKRRKEMEARRPQGQQQRTGQGQAGGQRGGQGGGAQGGGAQGGRGGGGGRGGSSAERMQRRKARLDQESAVDRAQRHAYFDDLRKRREQRGLSGGGFGPR